MAHKKRLLLIEDEEDIASLIKLQAELSGYKLHVEVDGLNGYRAIEREKPDLVILDIMLPGQNGFDICRKMKSSPELRNIPVIILSAKGEELDIILGLELGADDYLPKSAALHELSRTVSRVMARRLELQELVDRPLGSEATFKGDLEKLGLPAILFLLESVAKTGTLRVTSPRGRAMLFLREGAVIGAEMLDTDALRDAHLVYHAATWTRGEFEFVDGPVAGDDAIRMSTPELLLEAARRQDEASDAFE